MGVVDELLQAREDYERGEWAAALETWSCVQPDDMDVEDLRGAAMAAYLLGRREVAIGYYQRAFHLCERAGDPGGAVRCAFHVAMIFCGLRTVTVDCQPLMLPFARMVTVPLKRSFHFWPSEYVAVQLPPPVGGGVVVVGVGFGDVGFSVGVVVPPALSWFRTLV